MVKKFIFSLLMLTIVIFSCFFIAETVLRVLPIPGVQLSLARYDNITGGTYYPHVTTTYINSHGDIINRATNDWGYLDINHEPKKPKGVIRIGFFGDSFTEAKQVPLNATFFKIIENNLEKYNVETIAFGISGYSTLQSYLTSRKYSDLFDLDIVVYVFVENDLGDQIQGITRMRNIPYAVLTNDGFTIDNSFQEKNRFRAALPYRILDFLTAHSLLMSTLSQRIKLLLRHGINPSLSEEERSMATQHNKLSHSAMPLQTDLPSTWPEDLKNYAMKLAERIILRWRNDVEMSSKKFVILYVPRESEWKKPLELQDSWKSWLVKFCASENIDFVDPTDSFLSFDRMGKKIYDNHFTPDGHQAFADSFTEWFKNWFKTNNRKP